MSGTGYIKDCPTCASRAAASRSTRSARSARTARARDEVMSCEHCEHCERSDFTGDLRASLRACECECHDIARRFGSLPKLTSGVKS